MNFFHGNISSSPKIKILFMGILVSFRTIPLNQCMISLQEQNLLGDSVKQNVLQWQNYESVKSFIFASLIRVNLFMVRRILNAVVADA